MLIAQGMTGATGIVYTGLPEYSEMAFALHYLREGDLFVDVGANVGAYTILAAAVGARAISFEPVSIAARHLAENVRVNDFADLVEVRQAAVGSAPGEVRISTGGDTVNRVLAEAEPSLESAIVPVERLDDVLGERLINLLKVDVEGWEQEVFAGAATLIANRRIEAVIVEMNGSGRRYGFADRDLHQLLRSSGFTCIAYSPPDRAIVEQERPNHGNGIYVIDPQSTHKRVGDASPRSIGPGWSSL